MFFFNILSDLIYKRKFGHIYHIQILKCSINFCKLFSVIHRTGESMLIESCRKKITPFLGRECKSKS